MTYKAFIYFEKLINGELTSLQLTSPELTSRELTSREFSTPQKRRTPFYRDASLHYLKTGS